MNIFTGISTPKIHAYRTRCTSKYGHVSIRGHPGRSHGRGRLHRSNVLKSCTWPRSGRVGAISDGCYYWLLRYHHSIMRYAEYVCGQGSSWLARLAFISALYVQSMDSCTVCDPSEICLHGGGHMHVSEAFKERHRDPRVIPAVATNYCKAWNFGRRMDAKQSLVCGQSGEGEGFNVSGTRSCWYSADAAHVDYH